MELTTLHYFVTLAQELHFRKAAEKLHMTQAPLSIAIRKLEDELGCTLFERSSRFVRLTPAGEFFLREAQWVLLRAQKARESLEQFLSGSALRLTVGYNELALNTVLPGFLACCNQELPPGSLDLRELETAEQIKALEEGTLDVGFMRPYGFELGPLRSRVVHREKYVLAIPSGHKLAGRKQITQEMLSRQDVILFTRDVNPVLFDLLCAGMTSPRAERPNIKQSARTKRSMLAMVRAGLGVALLPESCLLPADTSLAVACAAFELPSVEIMAVWNPEKVPSRLEKILDRSFP